MKNRTILSNEAVVHRNQDPYQFDRNMFPNPKSLSPDQKMWFDAVASHELPDLHREGIYNYSDLESRMAVVKRRKILSSERISNIREVFNGGERNDSNQTSRPQEGRGNSSRSSC
jgi:hypothetical protein